jgi:hypothetical protein
MDGTVVVMTPGQLREAKAAIAAAYPLYFLAETGEVTDTVAISRQSLAFQFCEMFFKHQLSLVGEVSPELPLAAGRCPRQLPRAG